MGGMAREPGAGTRCEALRLAGRTTSFIAHRLSAVRRADLILLMEDGRIIERGTHAALMAAQGSDYRMVQRQAAGAGPREEALLE